MKKSISILLILLYLSLTACIPKAPCINDLWQIQSSQYVLSQNDCCDKAVKYCNILNDANFDAHVVVGSVNWNQSSHAWVSIIIDGIEYYVDPTCSLDFKEASKWSDRTIKVKYMKGVTPQEVRKYLKIEKNYDPNS